MIGASPISYGPIGAGLVSGAGPAGASLNAPACDVSAFGGATAVLVAPMPAVVGQVTGFANAINVALFPPSPTLVAFGGANLALVAPASKVFIFGGSTSALTAPRPRLQAAARSSLGDNSFTYTAPSPALSFHVGGTAGLTAPSPTLDITATVVNLGRADLRAPRGFVAGKVMVSASAYADLTFGFINGGSYTLEAHGGGIGAALTAPRAALAADATAGSVGIVDATAPTAGLEAYAGASAALVPPTGSLASSATKHALVRVTAAAPSGTLAAFSGASANISPPPGALSAGATRGGLGSVSLRPPSALLVGYSGAVASITLTGSPTLQATGTTGSTGGAQITAPLFELAASGTAQNYGSASLLAPAARLGATAQAWLMAPRATLTAIGTAVVTATFEAYAVNLNHAPKRGEAPVDETTHYTNFPFTHVVRYRGSYFGANSTGLYLLEGTTDDGADINYAVKTATSDLDSPNQKIVASAYFSGRLGPDAAVTLYAGEGAGVPYTYTTPRGALAQNHRQVFGKGIKQHRYYALGLSGSDVMELDNIELDVKQMNRRI